MTRKLLIAAVVVSLAGAGWYYRSSRTTSAPEVRTAPVTRGAVVKTVSATGATQAVTSVSVGSQVSGTIASLGADFNTVVKRGQVIARLDPLLLQAQVEQARANLTKVNADADQIALGLRDKQAKLGRAEKLHDQQLVSDSDLSDARLAVDVGGTDVAAAKAQQIQAQASLNQALLNLSHAVITAPIDGTVIERSVDVGQTVAASLSSPTLFVIAADLTEMRVSLAVDESDISQVAQGQTVIITVSAYPGERFTGQVSQVRLQPVVASNVTTYTTIVDVANEDMKLKPGMTANAQIQVARRDQVLRVPNAALRFAPTADIYAALGQIAPVASSAGRAASTTPDAARGVATPATASIDTTTDKGVRVVLASAGGNRPAGSASRTPSTSRGTVWVFEGDALRAIPVRIGISDGKSTEVMDVADGTGLTEGSAVVTSVSTGLATTISTTSSTSTLFTGNPGRGTGPR